MAHRQNERKVGCSQAVNTEDFAREGRMDDCKYVTPDRILVQCSLKQRIDYCGC